MTTDVATVAHVVRTSTGLEWLILPDESIAVYTNMGNGRNSDASSLPARVNDDPALSCGHTDWRLPTIGELESLINTDEAPGCGSYWSSSLDAGHPYRAWSLNFDIGCRRRPHRDLHNQIRLVRNWKLEM